jgi:selenocysteine lyase/cysteine desulfurase
MEHHSNHVSWMETDADVVVLPPAEELLVDSKILEKALIEYKDRKVKIGAFTACSNVTGIITPYYEMAALMHQYGGYCIVDFAASGPYVSMDMHPANPEEKLDAICFSPHKFLGGPGSCGILVFDKELHCGAPCVAGGGNVKWTDPWGGFGYTSDMEAMEDGGTPGFLQAIRAAMAIVLKDQMVVTRMHQREKELLNTCFTAFEKMEDVEIVGGNNLEVDRIGVVAFNIEGLHYNLVVRILNDRFGVQARGGWSCASTYCHYLFDIDKETSRELANRIDDCDMHGKPGWVRVSLHPTMTDGELNEVIQAVSEIRANKHWGEDYYFEPSNNEYYPKDKNMLLKVDAKRFFKLGCE